jgi:hypothetical protein
VIFNPDRCRSQDDIFKFCAEHCFRKSPFEWNDLLTVIETMIHSNKIKYN